jgi:O-antigen ligase
MAHNDYLHFISEAGLPLIAIIAWMMIALYRKGFQKLKNPSRLVRGVTLGAMSGITAILVHSIFDFNLHIPANALLFTVLAATVVGSLPLADEAVLQQNTVS